MVSGPALAVLLERLAMLASRGAPADTPDHVAALDLELSRLATRYEYAARVTREGALLPTFRKFVRGLLAALP